MSKAFPICTRRLQFGNVRASSPWSSRFASDGWSSGTFARRQCTVPVFHARRCNDCSAFRLAPLAAVIVAQRFGAMQSLERLRFSASTRCVHYRDCCSAFLLASLASCQIAVRVAPRRSSTQALPPPTHMQNRTLEFCSRGLWVGLALSEVGRRARSGDACPKPRNDQIHKSERNINTLHTPLHTPHF